jgi:DNA-binding NarL/FixJ family response regulator
MPILAAMPTLPARLVRVTPYEEATRAHDPLTRLRAHMLPLVVGVVPAALATFATVNRRLTIDGVLLAHETGDAPSPVRRLWPGYLERIEAHDPLAPRRVADAGASVLVLSQLRDDSIPAAYVEHLRELGAVDIACVYLCAAGSIAATISLVRGCGEEPVSVKETMLLRRLQPLLEQGYVSAQDGGAEAVDPAALGALTPRESEVAELVAAGARNAEIAYRLAMSPATVKTHLTQIYAKLGVRSRTQLAVVLRAGSAVLDDRG